MWGSVGEWVSLAEKVGQFGAEFTSTLPQKTSNWPLRVSPLLSQPTFGS